MKKNLHEENNNSLYLFNLLCHNDTKLQNTILNWEGSLPSSHLNIDNIILIIMGKKKKDLYCS